MEWIQKGLFLPIGEYFSRFSVSIVKDLLNDKFNDDLYTFLYVKSQTTHSKTLPDQR